MWEGACLLPHWVVYGLHFMGANHPAEYFFNKRQPQDYGRRQVAKQ